MKKCLLLLCACLYFSKVGADVPMPAYQVCFTPGGACTALIVKTIGGAK